MSEPEEIKKEIQLKEKQLYERKINSNQQATPSLNTLNQSQSKNYNSQEQFDDNQKYFQKDHSAQQKHPDSTPYGSLESTNQIQVYDIPKKVPSRKKYGSMIIFCESKHFLLSIGPNYLFFIITYTCFTLATLYLVGLANESMESHSFKIFNFVFCWLQNLSYLMVALSNPGVKLPETDLVLTDEEIKNKRFCAQCGAVQERKTYHCRECDVCIKDYDHHCPWTSKCIGGGNLNRFYLFVCTTPFYIFYYMVVFMMCMANTVVTQNKNLKVQPKLF